MLLLFFSYLCRFPPPPSSTCLPSSSLLFPARPGWSLLTYSLAIAAIRQRHTSIRPPLSLPTSTATTTTALQPPPTTRHRHPPCPEEGVPAVLPNPRGRGISAWICLDGGTCQHADKLWMESVTDMMGPMVYSRWCGVVQPTDTLTAIVSG